MNTNYNINYTIAKHFSVALLSIALICYPAPSSAINTTVENIDPGRIRLEQPQSVEPSLKPEGIEPTTPQSEMPMPSPLSPQLQVFSLKEVKLIGNTIFSTATLESLFKAKLNTNVSLLELQEVAEKITAYYRNSGFVLTKTIIPPQQIENGIVLYNIIEGYIDDVEIQGNTNAKISKHLLAFAKRLLNCKPFKITELERYALLANGLPGISIKTFIAPKDTKAQIGTAKLIVLVTKKPNIMSANYNNHLNEYYGHSQFTATGHVQHPNTLGKTNIIVQTTAPKNSMQAYYLEQEFYLLDNGSKIAFGGQLVKTIPTFKEKILEPCNTHGNSFTANISGTYPVILTFQQSLYLTLSLDIANINSFAKYENGLGKNLRFMDKIRTLRLSNTYEFTDNYLGSNLLFLQLSQGLNILNATKASDNLSITRHSRRSKPGGTNNFTKFNTVISRLQFTRSKFSLLFGINGQYSFHELLSSEKYGFGGSQFGKAYSSTIIDGDHGIVGFIEPRYDFYFKNTLVPKIQLFGNYELGFTWNKNKSLLGEAHTRQTASSAAIGIRASSSKYFALQLLCAKPLTKPNDTASKSLRMFISSTFTF